MSPQTRPAWLCFSLSAGSALPTRLRPSSSSHALIT